MNSVDREIRRLFTELDEAAPAAPPMPRVALAPRRTWVRIAAPAAAVASVVLALGLAATVRTASDDASSAAAGDTTTTVAAEGSAAPALPSRVSAVAELNKACETFRTDTRAIMPAEPSTASDYRAALGHLASPLVTLTNSVAAAAVSLGDPDLDRIAVDVAAVAAGLEAALAAPVAEVPIRYRQVVGGLDAVAQALAAFGAEECAGLSENLPE